MNFKHRLYFNSRKSEDRLVCKVAGECDWLEVGLANIGYVVWLCVVVDRLALICWQLIWLLVTLWHGEVADCGLYLPTDGHKTLFSSILSFLQYLAKYIELCASWWCSALRGATESSDIVVFVIALSKLHVLYCIIAYQNQISDFVNEWHLMFRNCLVVYFAVYISCNRLIQKIILSSVCEFWSICFMVVVCL